MCLCIPSIVIEMNPEEMTAVVDTLGVMKEVSTNLIAEPIEIGDHLLIHVGFAISKIDQQEAKESLETYKQLLDEMDPAEVKALLA